MLYSSTRKAILKIIFRKSLERKKANLKMINGERRKIILVCVKSQLNSISNLFTKEYST